MIGLAYRLYGWMLRRQLAGGPVPRHVAMVMDGNRRWARQQGYDNPSVGHRYGGEHLEHVLGWCAEVGIRHVTVFVASSDNLRKRDAGEVGYLMTVIEDVVADRMARGSGRWRLHVAGQLDALPSSTAHALKEAVDATAGRATDSDLTVAVGYDGREEVAEAVRSLLTDAAGAGTSIDDLAQTLTVDDIAERLYTSGRPDPDLVIRTSGEQRISAGFLMWQSAYSELYFCDVYWPGFRRVDFLRALRSYAARRRRSGDRPAGA
jgi:short-chain Z-isoprenyl diphosphate synthase